MALVRRRIRPACFADFVRSDGSTACVDSIVTSLPIGVSKPCPLVPQLLAIPPHTIGFSVCTFTYTSIHNTHTHKTDTYYILISHTRPTVRSMLLRSPTHRRRRCRWRRAARRSSPTSCRSLRSQTLRLCSAYRVTSSPIEACVSFTCFPRMHLTAGHRIRAGASSSINTTRWYAQSMIVGQRKLSCSDRRRDRRWRAAVVQWELQ